MTEDKNKKDYAKGKIYCIRNTLNDDVYIGSTCQTLSQRMALHRHDSIKPNRQNTKIYGLMTEHGRDNFYFELIEDYPCENIYQLQKREGEIIREQKPRLNMKVPTRTKQEYKDEEPEKFKTLKAKDDAKYRENNAEQLRQKKKDYYEQNREYMKQKSKEYRENNRDYLNQKKKEYYQKNKINSMD